MNIIEASKIAAQFLVNAEGFKSHPYLDSAGVWTNGFGNTNNVSATTPPITWNKGLEDLNNNILKAYNLILGKIDIVTKAALTNHEGAALIAFVYNAGAGNWNIWKLLNKQDFASIPQELMRFDHAHIKGKLVEVKGLKNRREAEVKLWTTGDVNTPTIETPKVSVAPMPNPAKVEQSEKALITTVATSTVGSVGLVAYHLSPQVVTGLLVGTILTLIVLITIGVWLYFKKSVKPNIGEMEMAASQAMTDALTNLKSAYDAKVEKEVKAATDAANAAQSTEIGRLNTQIAQLQNQLNLVNQIEQDDVAAVVAATPALEPQEDQ